MKLLLIDVIIENIKYAVINKTWIFCNTSKKIKKTLIYNNLFDKTCRTIQTWLFANKNNNKERNKKKEKNTKRIYNMLTNIDSTRQYLIKFTFIK